VVAQGHVGHALAQSFRTRQPKWYLSPQFETPSKRKLQHNQRSEIAFSVTRGTIGKERQSSFTIYLKQQV
jgi:hypothetical protein